MFTSFGFGDFDRTIRMMDEFRRRMDRLWDDFDTDFAEGGERWLPTLMASTAWPRVNLYDAGPSLILVADVPGMGEKELNVSLNAGVFTLSGERKSDAPEGYSVHRQERGATRFTRSVALPCGVDSEKTTATVKDGVLTVTLAKAPEAQPRQISIRAS